MVVKTALLMGLLGGAHSLSVEDAAVLVQRTAGQAPSMMVTETEIVGPLKLTSNGPVAFTELGPIMGAAEDDHFAFRGIPYAEPPRRFNKAQPKAPWSPKTLNAKNYAAGCIGSATNVPEDEDCLHLNVWMPKGGHTNMPVVVYFHGGLNMHGSGAEALRQGDGLVQSSEFPAIFINFDYRLGIFGWLASDEEGVNNNVGFHDQQEALRWVHRNIAAFGGDPTKVALMGQSEGGSNIMNHLAAPSSAGLFHRAIFHSPPAEIWSDKANIARTSAMVRKVHCARPEMRSTLDCLRQIPAQQLWKADWTPEDLSRNPMSARWFTAVFNLFGFALEQNFTGLPGFLGWHLHPSADSVPGNVHDLIATGEWNKVPILITVSKNETMGVIPGGEEVPGVNDQLRAMLKMLTGLEETQALEDAYEATLLESGIAKPETYSLLHQMLTDKLWTCEAWALAKDIAQGGGSAQFGLFWHSPRWDPVGTTTNKICGLGATCHAAEMLYSLPQGHGRGIPADFLKEEAEFASKYRDEVLSFVYGNQGPWAVYKPKSQVATFYDRRHGARVEAGYRQKQCKILDKHMADFFPEHMRKRATAA